MLSRSPRPLTPPSASLPPLRRRALSSVILRRASSAPSPRHVLRLPPPGQTRQLSLLPVARFAVRTAGASAIAVGAGAYVVGKVDDLRTSVVDGARDAWTTAAGAAQRTWGAAADAAADARDGLQSGVDGASSWAAGRYESFKAWQQRARTADRRDDSDDDEGAFADDDAFESHTFGAGAAAAAAAAAVISTVPSIDLITEDPSNDLMLLTRKLIEVRSILMSIDHGDTLQLPSIVVIGSQSSGKSSVLEAIVGHEFLPKGNNMVTRRPIELTLIHTPPTAGHPHPEEFAEIPAIGAYHITDFSFVQQTLTDLNLAVPPEQAVSEEPIQLRVHSPRVPDLSLVDLPGYIELSTRDQPEMLKQKIAGLCDKYIRQPNIILAVCPADVDLANSPALSASRRVDPLRARTIGVVTKMDLVEPEVGASILRNEQIPLQLGYIGVVCKAPKVQQTAFSRFRARTTDGDDDEGLQAPVARQENAFFTANAVEYSQPGILVGTNTLKRRLMEALEHSMASSLHSISNAVARELDEAAYQFKVQYNDRSITAESYVAETIDQLKDRVNELAQAFSKPQMRKVLKMALDYKVLDKMAEIYWRDGNLDELGKLAADRKLTPDSLDPTWSRKLEAATSGLTKAEIGRTSTQLVVNALQQHIAQLGLMEPFSFHPSFVDRINTLSDAILGERFNLTADQVESCIKPYKYEVEVDEKEWNDGRQRALDLLSQQAQECQAALNTLKDQVGSRRLNSAVEYVKTLEDREKRRALRRASTGRTDGVPLVEDDEDDPTRPAFNPQLLSKAQDALKVQNQLAILQFRLAALKAKRCRSGPDARSFCPEIFLNIVADKLAYTAVMFINIELLAEFFYQFPRAIDSRLGYDLDRSEVTRFARENSVVRRHLDLQERKEKLELVADKLDSLRKLQQESQPHSRLSNERRGLFGSLFS